MGKIDPRRDYYADLELSRNADIVEIKKQFKKLGVSERFPSCPTSH